MIRTKVLSAADRRLRRACESLPAGVGEEYYREWAAELPAILDDPDVKPAAVRWFCVWLFACDQTRTVRRLSETPTVFGRVRYLIQAIGRLLKGSQAVWQTFAMTFIVASLTTMATLSSQVKQLSNVSVSTMHSAVGLVIGGASLSGAVVVALIANRLWRLRRRRP